MILNTEQKVTLTLKPITAGGNPTVVDGVPLWSVSDAGIVSLVVSPDGLTAEAIAVGPGVATISATADADLTAGVREIVGTLDIQVVAAEAVTLTIESGVPVAK